MNYYLVDISRTDGAIQQINVPFRVLDVHTRMIYFFSVLSSTCTQEALALHSVQIMLCILKNVTFLGFTVVSLDPRTNVKLFATYFVIFRDALVRACGYDIILHDKW